jgi:hypothetical protein
MESKNGWMWLNLLFLHAYGFQPSQLSASSAIRFSISICWFTPALVSVFRAEVFPCAPDEGCAPPHPDTVNKTPMKRLKMRSFPIFVQSFAEVSQ